MVFTKRLRERIRSGEITCSVRIWLRPRVQVGARYRMDEGEIEVDSIEPMGQKHFSRNAWRFDVQSLLRFFRLRLLRLYPSIKMVGAFDLDPNRDRSAVFLPWFHAPIFGIFNCVRRKAKGRRFQDAYRRDLTFGCNYDGQCYSSLVFCGPRDV
jgi:hypothetical protein